MTVVQFSFEKYFILVFFHYSDLIKSILSGFKWFLALAHSFAAYAFIYQMLICYVSCLKLDAEDAVIILD